MVLVALLASLWLSACEQPPAAQEEQEQEPPFAQTLLHPGDAAAVRGSQPGDAPEEVRGRETFDLRDNSDTLLVYSGQIDFNDSPVQVALFYNFDEFGLFELQFDLRPASPSLASDLYEDLRVFLTALYGAPERMGSGLRFTSFSPSNNVVEITLSDESAEAGTPFVSLNFLEPLDDEI